MTKIVICSCDHEAQDRLHGKYKRVANLTKKTTWRCTVCGKEHQ